MSSRYVWDQYYIKNVYGLQRSQPIGTSYTFPYSGESQGARGYLVALWGDYYEVQEVNGELKARAMYSLTPTPTMGRPVRVETDTGLQSATTLGKYLSPDATGNYSYYSEILVAENDNDGAFWNTYLSGNTVRVVRNDLISGEPPVASKRFYAAKPFLESQEKGNYKGLVSNSSSSKYSSNGITGNYWYVYKGSDTIDPYSVSYSKQNPQAGNSVTISVSARSPTYGGAINYQFSYSVNGGSTWTNIGSKTTATSVSVTIPSSANQFKARVVASDTWGFSSSTYVYGSNLILNESPTAPTYVTIPNDVYPGEEFEISWWASTDPDGNLAGYEVQIAYDGGTSWQSVSSSVTGTSLSVSAQEGHTSVQYRVRAKDTHGLVSSWAYSNTATIGQIKAYATVGSKLRAGAKIYATIGGKIRQVQKGYATVGGKIRKLF